MTKSHLRSIYLDKRKALTEIEISEMSRKIVERFFSAFDLSSINSLHCFISIAKFNEVDTSSVFEHIWNEFTNVRTFVPRVDRAEHQLKHLLYSSNTALKENTWGIPEPEGKEKAEPN